ncbi:MAG TPA: hypothetical protein VFN41_02650 [Candidatus Limnocylindrales bacterium]|nr:hypothetical protein [Candidatus Limnocylindrales bacterium]
MSRLGRYRSADPLRSLAATLVMFVVAGCAAAAPATPEAPLPIASPSTTTPSQVAEPSPSASTQASPAAGIALPAEWMTFASTRFAYSIEHPTGWIETPAASDWPAVGWPPPDGDSSDRFEVPGEAPGQLTISSDVLAADEVAPGRRAEIDQETALICRIGTFTSVMIDGAEGRQNDQFCFGRDHVIEVFVAHGDRIFLMYWLSSAEIPDTDRAIFTEMLKRFRFAV